MKREGHRYCKQYKTPNKGHVRWALFECINGRYRRVGTACAYDGGLYHRPGTKYLGITARAFVQGMD